MDNQNNMTITAANSTFYLIVPGLYDSPVKIEGYSTDAMVGAEAINPVVGEMGVDGHLSLGWVPTAKAITVTLAADSHSRQIIDDWVTYQDARREVMTCSAEFSLPGIGRKYIGSRGAITSAPPMPGANKTLQATAYTITFEKWAPTSL